MTRIRYFIQLGLYFFGLMLLMNVIATSIGLTLKHVDGILLVVLISNLASKYIIDNGYALSSREYWLLFFGSLGIYILYNLFVLVYISFFMMLTLEMTLFVLVIILAVGVVSTFLGFWSAKRVARKSVVQPVPIKVYSVTDEYIANYLINELSKHSINAFVDKYNLEYDPLLSTVPSAEVNIMLRNDSDWKKAQEIINATLEENKGAEPWVCPQCREESEGTYDICWNCSYER